MTLVLECNRCKLTNRDFDCIPPHIMCDDGPWFYTVEIESASRFMTPNQNLISNQNFENTAITRYDQIHICKFCKSDLQNFFFQENVSRKVKWHQAENIYTMEVVSER